MACRSEIREIQGRSYTVTQMPATVSIPIQAKLAQMISAAVAPLMAELAQGGEGAGLDAVAKGLAALGPVLTEYLPPEEFLGFVQRLVHPAYVSVEAAPVDFETEFSGDEMTRLYPVIAFVLEVNYARFFSAVLQSGIGEVVRAKLTAAELKESPRT